MQEENWDQYKVKGSAPAATGGNEFDQYKVKKKPFRKLVVLVHSLAQRVSKVLKRMFLLR